MNFYEVLGVAVSATPEEIKLGYWARMRHFHPNVNKSPNAQRAAQRINQAYETLRDPAKRSLYDLELLSADASPATGPNAEPDCAKNSTTKPAKADRRGAVRRFGFKNLMWACTSLVVLLIGLRVIVLVRDAVHPSNQNRVPSLPSYALTHQTVDFTCFNGKKPYSARYAACETIQVHMRDLMAQTGDKFAFKDSFRVIAAQAEVAKYVLAKNMGIKANTNEADEGMRTLLKIKTSASTDPETRAYAASVYNCYHSSNCKELNKAVP